MLVFCIGITIFVYMYSKYPSKENLLIGMIYIPSFYFIIKLIFGLSGKYGRVLDKRGRGIEGINVVMKDVEFNRIVSKRVTGPKGKYRFVMNKGNFNMEIENKEYRVENTHGLQNIEVKRNNTLVCKKIVVRKI